MSSGTDRLAKDFSFCPRQPGLLLVFPQAFFPKLHEINLYTINSRTYALQIHEPLIKAKLVICEVEV
jgi:hypothetical protein